MREKRRKNVAKQEKKNKVERKQKKKTYQKKKKKKIRPEKRGTEAGKTGGGPSKKVWLEKKDIGGKK